MAVVRLALVPVRATLSVGNDPPADIGNTLRSLSSKWNGRLCRCGWDWNSKRVKENKNKEKMKHGSNFVRSVKNECVGLGWEMQFVLIN